MIDYYGDYGIILFRKHIVRYIHGIRNAARMREALLAAQTVEEIEEILGGLQI
jgi:tRNA-dihydrouridine synthase